MRKLLPYLFVNSMLLVTCVLFAQEGEVVIVEDTVTTGYFETPSESLQLRPAFDSVRPLFPVQEREIPGSLLDSLKNEDDFWYANQEPKKKKLEEIPAETSSGKSLFAQKWFRDLLWIVILFSFIGVVVWYLVSSNILIFRKQARKIDSNVEEDVFEDIFSISYDAEIKAAEANGDYRLAVRLWYLLLLKELTDKGFIDYQYGRTNHDYVLQLYKTPYYQNFSRLTRNFEYTWYGQFALSANDYRMMRNDFSTFKEKLR